MTPIIRKPELKSILGIADSTVHSHVTKGILPKPISIGPRAVGFIRSEIEAIMRARVAGESESSIKELVLDLTAARQRPN